MVVKRKQYPKYQNQSPKRLREIADNSEGWDRVIAMAKLRIIEIKRSITTFEELRDAGMKCPDHPDREDKL